MGGNVGAGQTRAGMLVGSSLCHPVVICLESEVEAVVSTGRTLLQLVSAIVLRTIAVGRDSHLEFTGC